MTVLLGIICLLTAAMIGLHLWHLGQVLQIHLNKWFRNEEGIVKQGVAEFLEFAHAYQSYAPHVDAHVNRMNDRFVRDAARILMEGSVRGADLLRSLRQRAQTEYLSDIQEVRRFSKLDEVVPAIGWLLALCLTFWLVKNPAELSFQVVLSSVAGFGVFGLYGVLFSYAFLMPADRAFRERIVQNRLKNLIIVEALGHMQKGKKVYEIYDYFNIVLPPEHQVQWNDVFPAEQKAA